MKLTKVIVIGLPKTGTSTLAIMLRMLGYRVSGPEIRFNRGDNDYLKSRYKNYNAFQDYPWCFEWETFLNYPEVKFIILKRDKKAWYTSFIESYGGNGIYYLSHPYIQLNKSTDTPESFLSYYETFYSNVDSISKLFPEKFLSLSLETFTWKTICQFLGEPIPKNFFGKTPDKPHINKKNKQTKASFKYRFIAKVRNKLLPIIGENKWHKFVSFLRKQGIY